jgi:4-hydroxy-tetrahydrodipicolinate synthase
MFKGVYSALITPFRGGQIDEEALARLIDYQIEGGVHGIVPCGTTGESATLTTEEHRRIIALCVKRVAGRVHVMAGTGSNATQETLELTRFAKSAGADGVLVITPYYNKPTQEGLYRHFQTVAEAVDIPLVLYNVPGRTAVDLKPETVARLAGLPTVVAIKDATSDMERAATLHRLFGKQLTLLSGDDITFLPFLSVGGDGVISVTANVAPRHVVRIWERWQTGDVTGARNAHEALLELSQHMFCETNPIPVKAAASLMGLCFDELRLPLTPLSESCRSPLKERLARLGLLS